MKSRIIGLALCFVSAMAIGFSIVPMAKRAVAHNEQQDFDEFEFSLIGERTFNAWGRDVALLDAIDEDGKAVIRLTYGETERLIPVKTPPAKDMPTLELYDEWLKVLRSVRIERDAEGSRSDEVDERLVVVTRLPAQGYDEETWGKVRRNDQTFRFYELDTDGDIAETVWRWPRSEKAESYLPLPGELAEIPPLQERSFEYHAALHVIPKLAMPKYKFNDTAVFNMGWTLPTAAFSGLLFLLGIVIAAKPTR